MKKWLSQFIQQAKQAFVRHPLEILFVTICVLPILLGDPRKILDDYRHYLAWAPIVFMLINLAHGKKYYIFSVIVPITLALMTYLFGAFELIHDGRFVTLNIAVLILFLCRNISKSNRTFMGELVGNISNCAFAGVLALVFGLVTGGLLMAISVLFHVDMGSSAYARVWSTVWLWIFPVAYLSLSQREKVLGRLNDLSRIALNWILSPALIVYTLIIYAYAASILVQGKMPEGMIANVAFPYLLAGIALYSLQILLAEEKWHKFYRLLPWLNLLPLAMLWYAVCIRIEHYGLTSARIYLVLGAIVLLLWNIILLVPKIRQYRLLAAVALLALLSNSFVFNGLKMAYQDQLARFDHFVETQKLLNDDGKLTEQRLKQWAEDKQSQPELIQELNDRVNAVIYLIYNKKDWQTEFNLRYGIPKEESIYAWVPRNYDFGNYQTETFEIEIKGVQSIDIQPYNHFVLPRDEILRRYRLLDYDMEKGGENCRIHHRITVDLDGVETDAYAKCSEFPTNNHHIDFVLKMRSNAQSETLEWNIDQYLSELFARHNLDIHRKYTRNELGALAKDLKPYMEIDGNLILLREIRIEYVERDNYKGYAFESLHYRGLLLK